MGSTSSVALQGTAPLSQALFLLHILFIAHGFSSLPQQSVFSCATQKVSSHFWWSSFQPSLAVTRKPWSSASGKPATGEARRAQNGRCYIAWALCPGAQAHALKAWMPSRTREEQRTPWSPWLQQGPQQCPTISPKGWGAASLVPSELPSPWLCAAPALLLSTWPLPSRASGPSALPLGTLGAGGLAACLLLQHLKLEAWKMPCCESRRGAEGQGLLYWCSPTPFSLPQTGCPAFHLPSRSLGSSCPIT